ncbi:MAG TPA: DUF4349 domain-containing protein [Dehalococcoidia bacterium]|nr:DUF4349 domain-containing protein [Dehalococcoidia bacterium]
MNKRIAIVGLVAVAALALTGWFVGSSSFDTDERREPNPFAPSDTTSAPATNAGAVGARAAGDSAAPDAPAAIGAEAESSANATEASTLDRTIIRTASLDLTVENVTRAFEDVERIATGVGGFVASSSLGKQRIGDDEYQVGSITIRVPDREFEGVMARLRGLAVEVVNESSETSDVTEEFSDLQARLRNLEATERQYLAFLERAQDLDDILVITDRINQVRAEIEQTQGRINLLQNLSELATITAHLTPAAAEARPPEPEPDGVTNPLTAAREAWERSLETLAVIASGVLAVVVYSWWIVPPAAAGAFALRAWWRRTRPATRTTGTAA